jgi:flavin-dependent dehydrogenase
VEHTYFFSRRGQALRIHHSWISRQYPYGLAIPRERLDSLLLHYARQLGVQVLEGYRIVSPIERHADRFIVQTKVKLPSGQHQQEVFTTPVFLDATGRSGKLTLQSTDEKSPKGTRKKSPNGQCWVGLQCHVSVPKNTLETALRMFLFSGGYGGIQPIADDQANCCMMLKADLIKTIAKPSPDQFDAVLAATMGQNPVAQDILRHAKPTGGFATTADIHLSQSQSRAKQNQAQSLIRLGDAQINVDPFTGSGMAHALQTGILAAEIVHAGLQKNTNYTALCRQYQQAYRRRFQRRLQLLHRFRPMLESERIQQAVWPMLPPFLPLLASVFR